MSDFVVAFILDISLLKRWPHFEHQTQEGGQRTKTDWPFLLHQSFLGSTDSYNSQGTS